MRCDHELFGTCEIIVVVLFYFLIKFCGIIEAVRRLRIQTDGTEDGIAVDGSVAFPDRPGEPDCIFYLRTGMCGYGNSCRFNHPTHIVQVNKRIIYNN